MSIDHIFVMLDEAGERLAQRGVPRSRPSKAFRWIIHLGIGLLLIWWIVRWANIDFEQLSIAFRQASLLDLALAILFFTISIALKTIQFRICLSASISNIYLFSLFFYHNALLTLLPWRIGELGLPILLRRHKDIQMMNSVSSVVLIRLVDFVFITTIIALNGAGLGISISWVTVIGILLFFGILVYIAKVLSRRSFASRYLSSLKVALELASNPITLSYTLFLSLAVFAVTTLQSAFALKAFGLTLPVLDVAILNAVSLIAAVFPLHPPGGWGTIDFVQVVLLQQLGYEHQVVTPIILVTHGFYTLLVLATGLLGWWLCRNTHRQ